MEVQKTNITITDLFPSLQQGVWIFVTIAAVLFFFTNMKQEQAITNERLLTASNELKRTNDELARTNANLKELASKVNDNENSIGRLDIRIENLEERRFQSLAPTKKNADQIASITTTNRYETVTAAKPEETKKKEEETKKGEPETFLGATGKLLDEGLKKILPN